MNPNPPRPLRRTPWWLLPAAGGAAGLWILAFQGWLAPGMGSLAGTWTLAGGLALLAAGGAFWLHRHLRAGVGAAEARLREAEEALARFFNAIPVGALLLNGEARVIRANTRAMTLLGQDAEGVRKVDWRDPDLLLLQADGNPIPQEDRPLIRALRTGQRVEEVVLGVERPDGNWAWVSVTAEPHLDPEGRVAEVLVTFDDITARKTAEHELAVQTFRDRLTSLPNRALFMERLAQALLRTERRRASAGVLFLDLDRFKLVNDSLGHEAGDQLLVQVARRLKGALRPEDTVARLSGDEFVVLLEDLPAVADALRVAERVAVAMETPFEVAGQEVFVSWSTGLAMAGGPEASPSELVRDAEVAMYRAKAKGERTIEVFDPSMNAQAVARFQLEGELRHALEREEFLLHYQPLVSLKEGTIEGWEALVRWKHPERGMVPPLDFISLAEETGLIVPLGKWVLEEAMRQGEAWQTRYPVHPPRLMNVNISARQFQQRDLVGTVTEALDLTRFQAHCLKLEITESVMMRDPQASLEAMKVFRGLDIHLVIDDFGTGYSSLSYLKRFPVDTLKVDKSFVDGLGKDAESTAIVGAVISLAKSLGMRVTAEGIETAEQLAQLRALGCDQGQGYFFSRPLPSDQAEALLAKNPRW